MSPKFKSCHLLLACLAFHTLHLGTTVRFLPPSQPIFQVKQDPGYQLLTCLQTSFEFDLGDCLSLCMYTSKCASGSYQTTTKLCCLGDSYIYDLGVSFATDTNSVFFQPREDTATHGNWTVAFRATTDNGQKVLDSFLDNGRYHDFPVGSSSHPVTCWSPSSSLSCTSHARSRVLDQWNAGTRVPSKVKYTMYKNGTEVAYVVFNGTGSTSMTWMAKQRILSSSYSDVNSKRDYNFCSVTGYKSLTTNSQYRFYVNSAQGGSAGGRGWMVVVDSPVCPWTQSHPARPAFLYSNTGAVGRWDSTDTGQADVMAVLVQF